MKQLLFSLLLMPFFCIAQVQIGQDINGEALGDQSGQNVIHPPVFFESGYLHYTHVQEGIEDSNLRFAPTIFGLCSCGDFANVKCRLILQRT